MGLDLRISGTLVGCISYKSECCVNSRQHTCVVCALSARVCPGHRLLCFAFSLPFRVSGVEQMWSARVALYTHQQTHAHTRTHTRARAAGYFKAHSSGWCRCRVCGVGAVRVFVCVFGSWRRTYPGASAPCATGTLLRVCLALCICVYVYMCALVACRCCLYA